MAAEFGFSEEFIDNLPLRSFRAYYEDAQHRQDRHIADMAWAFRIAQAEPTVFAAEIQRLRA